jgi:hypothetical protein
MEFGSSRADPVQLDGIIAREKAGTPLTRMARWFSALAATDRAALRAMPMYVVSRSSATW